MAVVTVLSLAQLACQRDAANTAREPAESAAGVLRVATITPQRKTIVRRTRQPGQVEAFQQAPLYAKVPGYVREFHVDIGDSVHGPCYDEAGNLVRRGDLMAELSIPELDEELAQKAAAVTQATAEVEQAAAAVKVAQTQVATAKARLEQAQAAVDRAKADREKWSSEYERVVKLAATRSVTERLVDETENQLKAAEAACRHAASLDEEAATLVAESEAKVEKAAADLDAARARLKVAEADQARTRALVDYQRIEAPFDGTVSERNVDVGHFVQPAEAVQSKPLFSLVETDVVRVFVDVPELDATLVDRGDPAVVRVQSLAGREFAGDVARSSFVLDPATRTLRTEIDVPNPQNLLRPGMYVYATIDLERREAVLTLPTSAVRRQESHSTCFCVEGGKLAEKAIETGLSDGVDVEIISGLEGNEAVVQKILGSLSAGQPAEAVRDETPGKT